jgi:cysteine desulfurase
MAGAADIRVVYLDNASTTAVLPAVWDAMRPYAVDDFGNPASGHRVGRRARQALEEAREEIAALLGAHADEVVFTSGATEANNMALFGLAGDAPGRLLVSPIEHPAVLEPVKRLAESGCEVEWLRVDGAGVVRLDPVGDGFRTAAVMLVNHETGAVQPVRELVDAVGSGCRVHCDAVQAVGKLAVDLHGLGVATLALSGHKFHGPKGVGALLVRRGVKLRPTLYGGHQQGGRRPGTEAPALAVGLATALKLAVEGREEKVAAMRRMRRRFLEVLRAQAAPARLNGPDEGAGHILNVSFPGLRSDALVMALDLAGVACSAGSACASGSMLPSPVLRAMGVAEDVLRSAVRLSFSSTSTEADVEEAGRRIVAVVTRLRALHEEQ